MKKERTDELFAMRSSTERLKILFFSLLIRGSRGTKDNFHRQSLTPTR